MFIRAAATLKAAPICRRGCSFVLISLVTVAVVLFFVRPGPVLAADGSAVGLSLFFENSSMPAITLYEDQPRYLQEIDIVATTAPSAMDQGIDPLINNSEFSALDWRGVRMVEEDWRAPGDGTFTRQRFYRGAAWMKRDSKFFAFPVDSTGKAVGNPLFVSAGTDNRWKDEDDGFVRRFTARQIATKCKAMGNCDGATFVAQGLAQFRDALHADQRAGIIPAAAVGLQCNGPPTPRTAVPWRYRIVIRPPRRSDTASRFHSTESLSPPTEVTFFPELA